MGMEHGQAPRAPAQADPRACGDARGTKSLGSQPFSIKSFASTNCNCITADIDPDISASKFILHPKADIERVNAPIRLPEEPLYTPAPQREFPTYVCAATVRMAETILRTSPGQIVLLPFNQRLIDLHTEVPARLLDMSEHLIARLEARSRYCLAVGTD